MFSEEMQALSISGNAEAIFWFAGISCAAVWIELESAFREARQWIEQR